MSIRENNAIEAIMDRFNAVAVREATAAEKQAQFDRAWAREEESLFRMYRASDDAYLLKIAVELEDLNYSTAHWTAKLRRGVVNAVLRERGI